MSRQEQIIERLTTLLNDQGCPPLVIQDVRWIVEDVFDIPDAVHYRPTWTYNGGWDNVHVCKTCGAIGHEDNCAAVDPCYNCGANGIHNFKDVAARWVKTGWWLFSKKGHWELDKSVPELS